MSNFVYQPSPFGKREAQANRSKEVDSLTASVVIPASYWNGHQEASIKVGASGDERANKSVPTPGPMDYTDACSRDSENYIAVSTYKRDKSYIPRNPLKIQVFVKTIRGNTVTCDLNEKSIVADLESAAYHKSGVPAEQQCLNFQGKRLTCKEELLTDYGITDRSTVYMMGRLRGGLNASYFFGNDNNEKDKNSSNHNNDNGNNNDKYYKENSYDSFAFGGPLLKAVLSFIENEQPSNSSWLF